MNYDFSSDKKTQEIVVISPEMARFILDNKNVNNRGVRGGNYRLIKNALLKGEWKYNGDPIRFDIEGNLLDGQHRLKACADTNIPIETLVVMGLDPETKSTIDKGAKRSFADTLVVSYDHVTVGSAGRMAAALRVLIAVANGTYPKSITAGDGCSEQDMMGVFDRHPDLLEYATKYGRLYPYVRVDSWIIGLAYIAKQVASDEVAEGILTTWKTGMTTIGVGDPILRCREALIIDRNKSRVNQMSVDKRYNLLVNAVRNRIAGKDIQVLKGGDLKIPGWTPAKL